MGETKEKNEKRSLSSKKIETSSMKSEKTVAKKSLLKKKSEILTQNFIEEKIEKNDSNLNLKENPTSQIIEYYDLPYRYNQTVIKILAQTPHSIFIYWDISDSDRASMINKYGENFFNETQPVLLVNNQTENYSFEIEIDDFTNSWYLHTPTSNCVYNIELGRKPKINSNIDFKSNNNILHITSSNIIESPNDHVLEHENVIYFKNIKTNNIITKQIANLHPIDDVYDLYKNEFINNPSSDFRI